MDYSGGMIAHATRSALRSALMLTAAAALAVTALIAPTGADSSLAAQDPAVDTPVITGVAKVGSRLASGIDPVSTGVDLQWMREDPTSATGYTALGVSFRSPEYTVRADDVGLRLALRVTPTGMSASRYGVLSDPTAPVAHGSFAKLTPKITGEAKVGKTLTLSPVKSRTGGAAVKISWLRDGKSAGAHGRSYALTIKDLGKRISARITQQADGYKSLAETTAATAKVTSLRYLTAAKPLVNGTVKVGTKLTAKRGSWTKGTTFRYQWYAAGKRIAGATKKSFTVTRAQRGKLMKVRVTGTKPKYEARAVSSAPARIAGIRGPRNSNGWAWPTDTRSLNQGYHEGYAIDIATTAGGPIFAAYKGTVVQVGGDGFARPSWCPASWWHGTNNTVVIRHSFDGRILYSAVNHLAPGSSKALGITVGTRVKAGQQVATEGMSGCTSGPHTHFVMRKTQFNWNGEIKPQKYIGKPDPALGGARGKVDLYGIDTPVLLARPSLLS